MNSKYNPHFCEQAKDLYITGFTDEQVARHFNVNRCTIYSWRHTYPEFDEAVKYGKYMADAKVVGALFKLATGWTEIKEVIVMVDKKSQIERINVEHPPQKEAIKLWLQTR